MYASMPYKGTLTSEQFLFYEMRIFSKKYIAHNSLETVIALIKRDHLFQYPTERMVRTICRACYRRLIALNNNELVHKIAYAHVEVAKQINLYAMMRYNRIVREFMEGVVGEKYRQLDFSFIKKDIHEFFSRLQAQNDHIAKWSAQTIIKIKQVLIKCLIETNMLDSFKHTTLHPIIISDALEIGIRENNDLTALAAFNCFR